MARTYDAIVIGSGLGGLTAGALSARAGLRVLVLERNESFGGAATVYRHNEIAIEASLHEIDGFDEDDPKLPLWRTLGLDCDVYFLETGDLYDVRGKLIGEPFTLPNGIDAALAAVTARFPQHKAALEEYFRRILALRSAVSFATQHQEDRLWWLTHAPEAVRKLWPILREGRASVGEALNDLFGSDEAVKLVLAANFARYHDDPDEMPFVRYAIPQASYLVGGGHYISGGSKALSGRLIDLIERAGGKLEAGREAQSIIVKGGRVTGVEHRATGGGDVQVDVAPIIYGNAAPQVLANMLEEKQRSAFLAPYTKRRSSISLWSVSLGLDRPARDFGVSSYSTFVIPDWLEKFGDLREAAAILRENPQGRMPPYTFVDYGRINSGLNATGPHLVNFSGIDRLENWSSLDDAARQARKAEWIAALVVDIDRHFPGMASAVVHSEMATAATMQRYLNTPGGAVYGFAPNTGLGQIAKTGPRTSIRGLWLASAYTTAGGYTGAMFGGAQAATQALRAAKS